jgi:hypothetical protein
MTFPRVNSTLEKEKHRLCSYFHESCTPPGYRDCLRVIFDPAVIQSFTQLQNRKDTHYEKFRLCVLLIELSQQLLKRKITMVGTVRKNKPELLPALLTTRGREAFSSKFAFTPTTTLEEQECGPPEHTAQNG